MDIYPLYWTPASLDLIVASLGRPNAKNTSEMEPQKRYRIFLELGSSCLQCRGDFLGGGWVGLEKVCKMYVVLRDIRCMG